MTVGFVNGCFDVLHIGHIKMLEYARHNCDYLIVALDSDERIKASKGDDRPYNNLQDRMYMIKSLKVVDEVKSFATNEELIDIIKQNSPDIMVVGEDWKGKDIIGSEHAKKLKYFRRIDGYSTTNILQYTSDR